MLLHLKDLSAAEKQYYLQHAVAPRPICLASTIDSAGNVNLSPFSFFNLFSANPPIVVFSPARRVRDNTEKHTLQNIIEVPEVAVHIVTADIVQQVSLSSCEYPKGVNEFIKAGFSMVPATIIKAPLVKESKIKMECTVLEVKALGKNGGAGNLVICEVLCMHIDDDLLDDNNKVLQQKINHVARLGGDWYCEVNESNLFEVEKPNSKLGIGIDALPGFIRNSTILSGNDLGRLANVYELPVINANFDDDHVKHVVQYFSLNPDDMEKELHRYAKKLLSNNRVADAWQVLLVSNELS